MSQENEVCVKCGVKCGNDDCKVDWNEWNKALCGRCAGNVVSRFCAFFGISVSSDSMGIVIEWPDVDRILSSVKKDYVLGVSYVVSDRQLYQRTVDVATPVENDVMGD